MEARLRKDFARAGKAENPGAHRPERALGQPVHNLLGGPCRDRIRVYANGWSGSMDSLDDMAENAREAVKKGWTALKFDPFPGPWRLYITGKEEHLAVDRVRTVREAVGPDSAR